MSTRLTALVLLIACLCAAPLRADEGSAFVWSGALQFDPGRRVATRNNATIRIVDWLAAHVGVSAPDGVVPVTGRLRYDPASPLGEGNAYFAAYPGAIVDLEATIGPVTFTANMPFVAANAPSSRIGYRALDTGAFCGEGDLCDALGIPFHPSGNQVILLNDAQSQYRDEGGVHYMNGDALGFMVGRTAAFGEFTAGAVSGVTLDGLAFGVFSAAGKSFFDDPRLRPVAKMNWSDTVARTELWVFFHGFDLFEPLRLEGVLTGFELLD